jgi:hypothetical protein
MTAFDKLYEKYLNRVNEDMPIDLVPGIGPGIGAATGPSVNFTDTANYKITHDQAARVIDDVVDYLRTRNNHSPLPYRLFQTDVVANKIVVHTPLNPTKAKYAARVVYNAMKDNGIITDERSGPKAGTTLAEDPTPEDVDEVANEVVAAVGEEDSEPVAVKPEREKITIPNEEEASVFFRAKNFPVEEVTVDEEEVLVKAWEKIPENEDVEWSDIVKLIGLTTADKLKNIKAILPAQNSLSGAEGDAAFIEDEDYIDPEDVTDTDRRLSQTEVERELDNSFRRTRSGYGDLED